MSDKLTDFFPSNSKRTINMYRNRVSGCHLGGAIKNTSSDVMFTLNKDTIEKLKKLI